MARATVASQVPNKEAATRSPLQLKLSDSVLQSKKQLHTARLCGGLWRWKSASIVFWHEVLVQVGSHKLAPSRESSLMHFGW